MTGTALGSDTSELRFAWYGRLSTDELQQPQLAFPSQKAACEKRIQGLGRIVSEFTDIQSGRSDDRAGIESLLEEASRAPTGDSMPWSPTRRSGSLAAWSLPSLTRKSSVERASPSTSRTKPANRGVLPRSSRDGSSKQSASGTCWSSWKSRSEG